ncbi:MAG: DUF4827 domain-containing protein [Prevotellaceae bacterium]|jgi:hypothetical protein|nr:DUF4827 domain-containing protein [Prevotellaceae bacterium]
MKKLLLLFGFLCVVSAAFQSCSNTRTYAEKREDEKKAIRKFIDEHQITVISQEEFLKDTITRCPPLYPNDNEYVLFPETGIYMQIVDRGTGDTIKNRDQLLVRFLEYDMLANDTTGASNYNLDDVVDVFDYTKTSTTAYGIFSEGQMYWYYNYYYSSTTATAVPAGWLVPLPMIRDRAHVKLIVPSTSGHSISQEYVYPYFYDLRKIQIW